MDTQTLLIIFENTPLAREHASLLEGNRNYIKLSNSPSSTISESIFRGIDYSQRLRLALSGATGAPRYLFELRDLYLYPLLPRYDVSLLIYGGPTTWMMPQYYVFKKLLGPRGRLFIFGDDTGEPGRSFTHLLSSAEFDGTSHRFETNSDLGFHASQEVAPSSGSR